MRLPVCWLWLTILLVPFSFSLFASLRSHKEQGVLLFKIVVGVDYLHDLFLSFSFSTHGAAIECIHQRQLQSCAGQLGNHVLGN
jgi:hypothetical protein